MAEVSGRLRDRSVVKWRSGSGGTAVVVKMVIVVVMGDEAW